jgi:hypothetical protein
VLNLDRVVFDSWRVAPDQRSSNDGAYDVLLTITTASGLTLPILLVAYLLAWERGARNARRKAEVP